MKNNDMLLFPNIKGHVKLELFDTLTGRRKDKVEGHNLITDYGLERFKKYCIAGIGGQFGVNNYFSENNPYEVYGTFQNDYWGILKNLILTDNTTALSATDRIIPGTLTGYASREPSADTTTTRGNINQNESYIAKDSMKIVMDFATDRANGIHKSVFWSDRAPGASNLTAALSPVYNGAVLARGYRRFAEADDGYFYGVSATTLYKIDPTTLAEIATYTLPVTQTANTVEGIFDVAAGYCYISESITATTLYVFDLADSTYATKTLPAASYMYGGAVIGNYLYYKYGSDRVYKFDIAAGTGEYKTTALQPGSSNSILGRVGSDLIFIPYNEYTAANWYDYDTNTLTEISGGYGANVISSYPNFYGNTHSLTSALWFWRAATSFYNASSYNTRYLLEKHDFTKGGANMITGKVLDTPVTKTSAQTMKVTYTITFT